ncbi:MAG: hypothetical protein GY755_16445 [Chloroflexi bacterium]|nr:hypothetical protein [Chloroflexota bacterium]
MNDINLENYFENIFDNGYQNEKENGANEDDDLWIDNGIKCRNNNSKKSDINNNIIIHIIRIPQIYYSINFDLSFYWLCCRISKFIFNIKKDFSHPLFQLFFKTIANFDCFMLSVPFIPLKGNLYQMFCQNVIGNYNHNVYTNINVENQCINIGIMLQKLMLIL